MSSRKRLGRIRLLMFLLVVLLTMTALVAAALEYRSINERITSDEFNPTAGIVLQPVVTSVVFQNVAVWDGLSEDIREGMSVTVENGKITALDTAMAAVPDGAAVVDGSGQTLIPGLIDAHVHLMSDSGPELLLQPDELLNEWLAMTARYPAGRSLIVRRGQMRLKAGVTTIRILGGGYYSIPYRDDAARWNVVAPRILSAGVLVNGPQGYISGGIARDLEPARRARAALELTSLQGIEAMLREHLARDVDVVKISTTRGDVGFGDAPPDLPEQWVREIVRIAHGRNIKVTAHSSGSEGSWAAIRGGVDGIEHLVNVPYELPDDMIDEIKRRGIVVTPTLSGSVYSATRYLDNPSLLETDKDVARHVPADVRRDLYITLRLLRLPGVSFLLTGRRNAFETWRSSRQQTLKNTTKLYRRGVRLIFGTDTPFPFGNFHHSIMDEVHALREAAVSNVDIMRMATSQAAEALGLADLGSIEVGKTADLVLVEGNPVADIEALAAVRMVMKEGRFVYRSAN